MDPEPIETNNESPPRVAHVSIWFRFGGEFVPGSRSRSFFACLARKNREKRIETLPLCSPNSRHNYSMELPLAAEVYTSDTSLAEPAGPFPVRIYTHMLAFTQVHMYVHINMHIQTRMCTYAARIREQGRFDSVFRGTMNRSAVIRTHRCPVSHGCLRAQITLARKIIKPVCRCIATH